MAQRRSGLLHATTGAGKTLAVGFGALLALRNARASAPPPLTLLWITPMRALAADTALALGAALDGVQEGQASVSRWTLDSRTGDTSSRERAAQARRLPRALITTPESLSLMLSRENAREIFAQLGCVVVDEWHELAGTKRGVQTQLALARLRRWRPDLMIRGMSATMGNLEEARRILLGPSGAPQGALVEARLRKYILVDTLLPGRTRNASPGAAISASKWRR
jgi:ATP-dependent helicase Lhr and Lhr-like helicase